MSAPASGRLRVLHLSHDLGANDFVDHVVSFADRERFELSVCSLRPESAYPDARYEERGFRHWVFDAPSRRHFPALLPRLSALLRTERINVLHTHHYYEGILGALLKLHTGVRHVLGRHYSDDHRRLARGLKLRGLLALEAFSNRVADVIVAPSLRVAEVLRAQGVPAEHVTRIPYGFDFEAERFRRLTAEERADGRAELGMEGRFVFANVGRHIATKGQPELLEAFARAAAAFPDAHLLFIGDGALRPSLETRVAELGLADRVTFAGWRRDGVRLVQLADAVVHPTHTEAFSQVMVEAMALARPLVMTPVSGTDEVIRSGETGLLVPIGDVDALTQALVRLLGDRDFARALGERAARFVRAQLDIRRIVPRFEALYERVAGRAPAGPSSVPVPGTVAAQAPSAPAGAGALARSPGPKGDR
ncbi:MAG: glycosyltransferase family 1 protein [Gemmatimonadetes bacterium]|nr:MAG: glycosyltransferase family 1 protein [Gemmatimonadota bacterium]